MKGERSPPPTIDSTIATEERGGGEEGDCIPTHAKTLLAIAQF